MRQILGQYIEPIRQETLNFLTQSQKEVYQVTDLVEPVYEIIKDYVVKGKFLRGSLVLFTKSCSGNRTFSCSAFNSR